MAAYKVINLDSPIESDYWVDIPVRDPATNKDAVDEKGRILVERHVTRSVKNEELSTINAAVETVNTLKEDYSTFKEEVSTKVNRHDSNILTNTNNITTLTDSVNNHDLQIHALYSKINAIQGIDIDDFKYVTETDIKNIKKNYLPLAGGTVTGNVVFAGSVSSNSPIKANLQGTADRAIGDINGKALTSYIANLKVSGASLTVTNGAGNASNYTVDNVNHATNATHATSADSATKATNATNANHANSANVATSSDIATRLKGYDNHNSIYLGWDGNNLTMNVDNVNSTKGVIITHKNISSQSVKHATNATNATKASQNASGYALANTIVKSIAISGRTITVTKIDGTSYTLTTQDTNTTYTKLSQFANDVGFITSAGSCAHAKTADNATKATNADKLGGYLASKYVRSVIGVTPDSSGNVQLGNVVAITGEIKWFAFNKAPNGYLVCNGANVSRNTYAGLFKVIGTTFGRGDGSTTFALPNLIDKFAQGSTTVGTVKSAGLPNITGKVSGSDGQTYVAKGAFTKAAGMAASKTQYAEYNESCAHIFSFSASNSNSIYGKSSTVQPPALTLLPCIKF